MYVGKFEPNVNYTEIDVKRKDIKEMVASNM
jgi:hypothetical protein